MEIKQVYLDTSPLIEFFRKHGSKKTMLYRIREECAQIIISTVTEYEILCGCKTAAEKSYWHKMLAGFVILPFDRKAADCAAEIFQDLKIRNRLIESRDLFIAAIAITNGLKIATLNIEHFARVKGLEIYN